MKIKLYLILILFFTSLVNAQDSSKLWDLVHDNNREEALKIVSKKNYVKDVETLLIQQIVRNENGLFIADDDFLEKFIAYPEFENYLYAHWNGTFLFNDYLGNGFDEINIKNIDRISKLDFKNSTLKNAVAYLNYVRHRISFNHQTIDLNKEMNVINSWEFCGVFENLNNSGILFPYEPEAKAYSKTPFDARSNGKVNWYEPAMKSEEMYQFFTNHSEYGYGVNYAQTFIDSEIDQNAILRIGKGGVLRVWLNDVLIIDNDKDFITELDAVSYKVNLQKGNNRLLIKMASEKMHNYFIVRIEDENGKKLNNIQVDLSNKDYKKGTEESGKVEELPNNFETYFKDKKTKNSDSQFLYDYSLMMTYLRNSKYEPAKEIISKWHKIYPQSSFLKRCLLHCLEIEGNNIELDEIKENLQKNDENYYLSILYELRDTDKLLKKDLASFNGIIDKINKSTDVSYLKTSSKIFKQARLVNLDSVELYVDQFLEDKTVPSKLKHVFAEFYSTVLKKDAKAILALDKIVNETHNYQAALYLSYYYKKQSRKEESLEVIKNMLDVFPTDNTILKDYVDKLQDFNMYEESIPFIDKALKNYPYSAKFLELKADALFQLDKKQEALTYYEKSLERKRSRNIRKIIDDIKGVKDPLEEIRLDDYYAYIEKSKKVVLENNYGFNLLLEEDNVLLYENGGGKYRGTYIYEVTAQSGIETLKEYNLNLSGNYTIYKSEIVKPNGNVVPSERSGSNFVFNNLEIGDIIYIDYDSTFNSYGRFYKDYVDKRNFDNYDPTIIKYFRILSPNENLIYTIENGKIPFKKYKKGDLFVFEWSSENEAPLSPYEDFMPNADDIMRTLHVSSISSWNDISNWYSDLVRTNIEYDEVVNEAFNSIFPEGIGSLSEDERAKRIYNYVTGDFSYSYVSFKQSGFVPQKPSKTIKTKLGDCKDFSTLYVTLARKAKIEAKLVLILTSDYGEKQLVLPSTDFNHCVVVVMIDGKKQYLELTDKFLPYKSIPNSLNSAVGLEIPYYAEKSDNSIFLLKGIQRNENLFKLDVKLKVGEEKSDVDIKTTLSGHLSSYYIGLMDKPNNEVLKDDLYNELLNRTQSNISLESFERIVENENNTTFTQKVVLDERTNSIGSMITFKLPFFSNPYNQSIINLKERKYKIDYNYYENADRYEEDYNVNIEEGNYFTEIPENKELAFKDHSYKVEYSVVSDNELKVKIVAIPGKIDILAKDYLEFKKFVTEVLDSRKQLFAYKKKA